MPKKVKLNNPKKNLVKHFLNLNIALFFLVLGLVFLISFFGISSNTWDKFQSRNWVPTEAEIVDLHVYYFPNSGGILHLSYEYSVNITKYHRDIEDKIHKKHQLTESIKQRWDSYKRYGKLVIFYNPQHPEESLLDHEREHSFVGFAGVILASILFFFMGGLIFIGLAYESFRGNFYFKDWVE